MNHPTLPRLFLCLLLLASAFSARAGDEAVIAAVRAADDERVAATLAADPARMDAIYSAQLHYSHSNGKVDTKKSYLDAVVSRRTVYEQYEYKAREFSVATPDIVLMTGRVLIKAASATGGIANEVSILAVWRQEGGKWRFLAWQSAKLTPPAAK